MKPICVPCHRFFRMKRSGFYFLEGMPRGEGVRPGTEDASRWAPYKIWAGDLWCCEGCGAEIISGVGQNRLAEHYQADFAETVEHLSADQFQVNDC
jgi:hypothetical protein